MSDEYVDPSDRDENVFRTDGRDVCHWCTLRPQEWLWGPYGTRVCDHCQQLIEEGRQWEIVEGVAARITVRDNWHHLDPEQWRRREHGLMARWLKVRTDFRPVDPADYMDE